MPRILCMEYYEHKNFNSYQAGRNLAMICLYFQYLFMRSGTTGKLELLSSIVPRVALACGLVLMSVTACGLRQFLRLQSNPSTATYWSRTSLAQSFGVRGLTEHPWCWWWSPSFVYHFHLMGHHNGLQEALDPSPGDVRTLLLLPETVYLKS